MELQYSDIEVAFVDALPELRPAAERYWSIEGQPGQDSGPYIFYESMFASYLQILLALEPASGRSRLLKRAFGFLERMLTSADPEVENLAYVATLEGQEAWWLTRAEPFLGPRTVAHLDRWMPGWKGSLDRRWNEIECPSAKLHRPVFGQVS